MLDSWHAYRFLEGRSKKDDHIEETIIARQGTSAEPPIDVARRFVRVTRRRPDGYIEFQFSIHHQELFVELVLPAHAFEEFCRRNQVTLLEPLK